MAGGFTAIEGWAIWEEHRARIALAEERFDEAQHHIHRALLIRPKQVSSNLLAARIARVRGNASEAEQYLNRCGLNNAMSESVQLEWLLLRCQLGDVDELAPGLLALVDHGHAESAAILETIAGVYMRQARYLEAIPYLDRWIEGDPSSARALDWRGWVSNQLDHRSQAISDYEQALKLQPGRSAVRLRLAQILVDSSRQIEAVPHLERLREEQPDNPEVLVALARCRVVQSEPDEARALLDAVLSTHPEDFDALLQRGKLDLQDRRFEEAERWLRKALQRMPQNAEARYSLCLSLQGQPGRQREAEEELEHSQRDRQMRDRLTRLLRTELNAHPKDPNLAREAGELLLQLGEEKRGLFWLHRALALDPRHAASHRALVGYYERTGNAPKAAEHRQKLEEFDMKK